MGLLKLFITLLFFSIVSSCSEDAQKQPRSKQNTAEEAPVVVETPKSDDAIAVDDTEEAEDPESEEPELPESVISDKSIHEFELTDGTCTFSFSGKTKAEGCVLMTDSTTNDCVIEYRQKVYDLACVDGGVSFTDALNTVLGAP